MILRTHYPDGAKHFVDMGDNYMLIEKEVTPEKFDETAKAFFGNNSQNFIGDTIGFVVFNNGNRVEPIYKTFNYCVLNTAGLLFDQIN